MLYPDGTSDFSIVSGKIVGHLYIVDGFQIAVYDNWPNWFHRLMTKWLLGWEWEKAK